MDWQEIWHDSSMIERIAYYNGELYVAFKRGGTYKYFGVPEEIYCNILNKSCNNQEGVPSFGASFIQLVRESNYRFEQI